MLTKPLVTHRVTAVFWPGRQQIIRPQTLVGRIISGFMDKWTCLFWPSFYSSESEKLTIFELFVRPYMSSWWLLGRPYFMCSKSVGRLKDGHEFLVLMIDGDEMCVWFSESGWRPCKSGQCFWRTDFRNFFDVTNRNPFINPGE